MLRLVKTTTYDVFARLRLKRLSRLFETPAQRAIREGFEILRNEDWRTCPSWLQKQRTSKYPL